MLEISGKTNLLEQNAYKYSLQDVAEPNLQRDIYTQGAVPKVPFNHRRVPMNMPEEIWITDTSLRDGQQSVEPYTVDQIVNIYKYLSRLGGPYGIIRQTEFFIYSKKDREALEKCMELGLKFPEITTWIRATKEDFRLVRDLGIRETGILVSCSDYHIFKKMKMTRRQAMDYYLATVADAFEAGVVPRCHLEDITRADFYGFVVPFVNELQKLSRQAGIPVKIRACDTMGYGIPYTEAALPRSVAGIVYGLQQYSDVPSECLEWHGHNDFYKAVVNASTAWLYGACAVNCSLLGIGERTGNIPLEAMVFEYASLRGSLDGMDPTVITEIADYFQHEIGYSIPPMTPFVGRDFNVTRAGIHADGDNKNNLYFNELLPERFGRVREYALGKTSGKANILKNLEALGIELDEASMRKVTERVVELSDKKELVTAEDLPYIIADVLRYDLAENPVRILNYSLSLAQGLHPAASLKIEINGCEYEQTSVGDGQYDAFMRALRQIYKHQLGREFPMLRNYTVSIPPGGRTDAFVQTIITWETGGKEFKTRGLDADQTEAAIKATIKMLNIIEPTYNDHGC